MHTSIDMRAAFVRLLGTGGGTYRYLLWVSCNIALVSVWYAPISGMGMCIVAKKGSKVGNVWGGEGGGQLKNAQDDK